MIKINNAISWHFNITTHIQFFLLIFAIFFHGSNVIFNFSGQELFPLSNCTFSFNNTCIRMYQYNFFVVSLQFQENESSLARFQSASGMYKRLTFSLSRMLSRFLRIVVSSIEVKFDSLPYCILMRWILENTRVCIFECIANHALSLTIFLITLESNNYPTNFFQERKWRMNEM